MNLSDRPEPNRTALNRAAILALCDVGLDLVAHVDSPAVVVLQRIRDCAEREDHYFDAGALFTALREMEWRCEREVQEAEGRASAASARAHNVRIALYRSAAEVGVLSLTGALPHDASVEQAESFIADTARETHRTLEAFRLAAGRMARRPIPVGSAGEKLVTYCADIADVLDWDGDQWVNVDGDGRVLAIDPGDVSWRWGLVPAPDQDGE